MSVNLMFSTDAADEIHARNWSAIKQAADNEHGMVFIDDATVTAVARLLDGKKLSNGEVISAYAYDADEPMASLVCDFGPSLLAADLQCALRQILAAAPNGARAVVLYDEVVRLGLQVRLSGKEFCDAYIKGVNCQGDLIEINQTSGNMAHMMSRLGLGAFTADNSHSDEIPLPTFERAVKRWAPMTDMPERLQAFVACAKRHNATHVYWA